MTFRSASLKGSCVALIAILVTACGGPRLRDDVPPSSPSRALPPATDGLLAELAGEVAVRHGADHSTFKLLDGSFDGLNWRLAIIDSATVSVDILTYLWYPDESGRLILERAIQAANRGVHVRLLVDDLLTIGQEQLMHELHSQPNIELRLFNPWKKRAVLSRAGEMIAEMERLNTRMHCKLVVADGRAAVVGGRNIGDHYFGLSDAYNFHDLDLLGIGAIGAQAAGMFDHFWNSEWVVSADNLVVHPDPDFAAATWRDIQGTNRASKKLAAFGVEVRDWRGELGTLLDGMHSGTSRLIYDEATAEGISQTMIGQVYELMGQSSRELLITNAYIIPGEPAIDFIRDKTQDGVDVRILTNSLASHDVPAVNSHYQRWRDDLIEAGARLYELRADAAIQSLVDVPPAQGAFVGLHTKSFVVDREKAFIGSMNFDPRSANINTEGGAWVHSPGLADELARVMERDMAPANAWQVQLDEDGRLSWTNDQETVYQQPARDFMQRAMDQIFKLFPEEQY